MTDATLADFLLARIAEDEIDEHLKAGRPDRVLAECEAKRQIVARIGIDSRAVYTPFAWEILQDIASVYADHPDFRDEWRP